MKQPSVAVGNRSAESARLAELLLAGIDSRPNGLRETALLLTAWTQLGVGYGMDRVWSPGQIRAAFRRLEKQGLATPVDEPDGRRWTPTSRALEAVESMLEGRASSATHRYEIAGRMLQNYPIPELLMLRDRLRQDVAREDAAAAMAAGRAPRGRIQVRFGP